MKKILLISLISILVTITAACGSDHEPKSESAYGEALNVYTTVYPLTYFTERIGGDQVNVQSVYPAGSNEHTFDPTQQDMMSLADADLFFYIGLGLEGFVENAKKTLVNEKVMMIATADAVSEETIVESEVHEDEDEHEDEHAHEDEHEDEAEHEDEDEHEESHEGHDHGEIDPHLWISPKISIQLASSIKDSLIKKDNENEALYTKNYEALVNELKELDTAFMEMANASENKTFFVSHAAFGYLAKDYGLEQMAVAGLNSQDEPSQKELTELVDLAKDKNIKTILFEQNVTSNLAKVIQNEVGAEALTMHNLSVLMQQDIDNNETYFTLMKQNLETLEKALQSSN